MRKALTVLAWAALGYSGVMAVIGDFAAATVASVFAVAVAAHARIEALMGERRALLDLLEAARDDVRKGGTL